LHQETSGNPGIDQQFDFSRIKLTRAWCKACKKKTERWRSAKQAFPNGSSTGESLRNRLDESQFRTKTFRTKRFGQKRFGQKRFGQKLFGQKLFGYKLFGQKRFGQIFILTVYDKFPYKNNGYKVLCLQIMCSNNFVF
jgi:hypothetical protein